MRLLKIASLVALGAAVALGVQIAGAQDDPGANQEMAKSIGEQAKVANELALADRQASALSELAIERSQNQQVLDYAREAKAAHQQNLAGLNAWGNQKAVEIAAVVLFVPERGTGGAGLTDEQKQELDKQAQKYGEDFKDKAQDAQNEIVELAQASPDDFDSKYLDKMSDIQEKQVKTAKNAQSEFAADTAFAGLMASTQKTFTQLTDQAEQLEDQVK